MSSYLPSNLVIEILYRLPAQCLLRFRCVSKLWGSLISSPFFISTHLTHSHSATPLLLLHHIEPKNQQHYSLYLRSHKAENFTLFKQLKFTFNTSPGNDLYVVGFCNGLVCLSEDSFGCADTIILWNPAIRKSVTLPKPSVRFPSSGFYMFLLGFGFDEKKCDFKVVRLAYLQDDLPRPPVVEVYSLSTGLWRTVNSENVHCRISDDLGTSVYLSGAIHWVSYTVNECGGLSNSLLVFDLTDEKFNGMCLPQSLVHVSPSDLCVRLCDDRISMFWNERYNHCAVWVMNQYGEPKSWSKKFVVIWEEWISHGIGFGRNGELLVVKYSGDLLSYDPESKGFKDLGINGERDSFFVSEYVESLMLLDGSSGATADPLIASDSKEAGSGINRRKLLQ